MIISAMSNGKLGTCEAMPFPPNLNAVLKLSIKGLSFGKTLSFVVTFLTNNSTSSLLLSISLIDHLLYQTFVSYIKSLK